MTWESIINWIDDILHQLFFGDKNYKPIQTPMQEDTTTQAQAVAKQSETVGGKAQRLYDVAHALLGLHIIKLDSSNNFGVYGCAQSVNAVFRQAFGSEIGGGASTALMYSALQDKTRFTEIPYEDAKKGDICIFATGTSIKFPSAHGHVLICGNNWLMSNSSESGTWEANYTYDGAKSYFHDSMGFPAHVYRIIE